MKTERKPDQDFVSTREAAELLGVSVRSVQLWVESGVLHAWKTAGGHRRIARASVEAVLAEQRAVIETVTELRVLKVVLIDDNPAQLQLYKLKLENLDLPIVLMTSDNGFDGLLEVGRRNPDVVIVSLDVHGISVSKMIEAIKQATPSTEVIALTKDRGSANAAASRLPPGTAVIAAVDDLETIEPMLAQVLGARRPGS